MEAFEEIKHLWQHQKEPTNLPSVVQILKKAESIRRKSIIKHVLGVAILALTFVYIFTFLFQYDFAFVTTYIGIIIVLIAIVVGLVFKSQLLSLMLPKVNLMTDAHQQLEQMLKYQTRLKYFHKVGLAIYFFILGVGFGLYLYEFAARDINFGIKAYSIVSAWIIFSWFFIRRRTSVKMQEKTEEYIHILKGIDHHINQ